MDAGRIGTRRAVAQAASSERASLDGAGPKACLAPSLCSGLSALDVEGPARTNEHGSSLWPPRLPSARPLLARLRSVFLVGAGPPATFPTDPFLY